MTNSPDHHPTEVIKTQPTIFPLGFSVSQIENSLVIIDFIDILNGKHTIIESIALPLEKANQLSEALTEATSGQQIKK